MKQAREIALSNAYRARAGVVIGMVAANAQNDKGLTAWYAPDPAAVAALSPEHVRAGGQMALGLLLACDNMLFQHERGFISDQAGPPAEST